jgi:hypothetical protein
MSVTKRPVAVRLMGMDGPAVYRTWKPILGIDGEAPRPRLNPLNRSASATRSAPSIWDEAETLHVLNWYYWLRRRLCS